MLLDSNIIIYSAQPEHAQLRELIAEYAPAVSALSYLEVLGYHLLTDQQRQYFEEFFQVAQVLPISQDVLDQAVIGAATETNDCRRCHYCWNCVGAWTNLDNKKHR